MQRHYYISDDLDELERLESELQKQGIKTPQFHVLSENDAEVEKHHLQFQELLSKGKHVFFVDISQDQQSILDAIIANHPKLILAGTGKATPGWVVKSQDRFSHLMKVMP